jgi:RNA-directed DNA polymerase
MSEISQGSVAQPTGRNAAPGRIGGDGIKSVRHEECSLSSAASEALDLSDQLLMEEIVSSDNLNEAFKRVKDNKGCAGVDGMSVHALEQWCRKNHRTLITSLLQGKYTPSPVLGIKIPKASGGKRQLGIPVVVDRLVQQAIQQVLTPILDPQFSSGSFGYRPGLSAHDALGRAGQYLREGYVYVVDMDLEKFFDRVNHDILMSRLARHVKDKRVLKLIRAFLNAGIMQDGVVTSRKEGTPQGGPLSPLLANLLLDDLDKELESRGHRFVRYADDCNIYVQSQRAGERVLASVSEFLAKKLKLRVNTKKSAVDMVNNRSFLGYRLIADGSLGLPPQTIKRFKDKVRQRTRRNKSIELEKMID